MPADFPFVLTAGILAVAFLYSSVGHAGASGYIAVMTLLGISVEEIKPVALGLNILVASIGTWQFWRAGHFSPRLYWPFALTSIPFAFLGGYLVLPVAALRGIVGIVLLYSAVRFVLPATTERAQREAPKGLSFAAGAGIGLLSGLTGTGGGIFLTPLLLLLGWARTRTAAAISAPFILVNSVAGLTGALANGTPLPRIAAPLAAAAVLGGVAGSYFGSRRFAEPTIKRLLAAVLTIAGLKLILS